MASDEESVASDYEYASVGHNTDDGSDYAVSRESTRDGFYVDDTDVMLMNGVWDGAAGASGGGRGFATFSLLTVEDLSARQAHLISEVTDLLGVDALSAKLLLRKYRWDVSTVTDNYEQAVRFLDQRRAALAEAASGCKASSRSSSKQTCGVCWDEVRTAQGLALGCGHFFCNGCLKSQFSVKINEGQSKRLSCMQQNCPEFYTEEQVLHAVDEDAGHKYIKQNVDYFVTDNPRLKFCPGPDCQMVAELRDSTAAPVVVKCACGHQWCFACASVPHFPLPCEYQRRWRERTADGGEMATVEFLKQTTKICPWCKEGVFRFDGCNFMTCRCSENFCYKCGGKVGRGVGHTWNTIDKHECGRLQGADGSSEVGDLQRFMHYLSNFKAQRQLPEDDARDRGAEREEIEDIQMVNKARRALANSYVFAFYAFEKGSAFSSRLTLFEDKQQRLEAEVEIFCRMIQDRQLKDEKRPSEVDIKSQRDKVKHWLQALHGTIHHDVLGDDAYGISIQEFDLDTI